MRRRGVWNQILRARGHNNAEAVLRQCVLYCHRLGAGLVLILIFGVCFHGSWSWMTRFLAFPRPQGWKPGPEITANMYSIDLALLKAASAPHLVSTFVPMARDSGTDTFLAAAAQLGLMSPRDRKVVRESLRAQFEEYSKAQREDGMSRTDASARYLRRTMFVATPEQFRALLIRAVEEHVADGAGSALPACRRHGCRSRAASGAHSVPSLFACTLLRARCLLARAERWHGPRERFSYYALCACAASGRVAATAVQVCCKATS